MKFDVDAKRTFVQSLCTSSHSNRNTALHSLFSDSEDSRHYFVTPVPLSLK